jgi:hypothetical protein
MKLTGLQLVKKFPTFYGTRRIITAFKSARHLSLSWASPIQSIPPHPTSWRFILILSSHLLVGLPSGPFTHQNPVHATLFPQPSYMRLLSHSRFYHPHNMGWRLQIMTFFHTPITSSLLGPNILLNTLFPNTLSLRFSLNVSDRFHTQTKQQAKLYSVYINNYKAINI